MLTNEIAGILSASKNHGWVLEPEAKRLFASAGLEVPKFIWANRVQEALGFAEKVGYPLVGKVVSAKVLHKSERNGVVLGMKGEKELAEVFDRFSRIEGFAGMLVEESVSGLELIIGAKIDDQFGPVILLGMGGTGVEIYRDVSLRMAPLTTRDAETMIQCLKARPLLSGYRGSGAVDLSKLVRMLKAFSDVVMDMEKAIESIDLNPVICSSTRCVIADARIILRAPEPVSSS